MNRSKSRESSDGFGGLGSGTGELPGQGGGVSWVFVVIVRVWERSVLRYLFSCWRFGSVCWVVAVVGLNSKGMESVKSR